MHIIYTKHASGGMVQLCYPQSHSIPLECSFTIRSHYNEVGADLIYTVMQNVTD